MSAQPGGAPLVSIITATYNRSNVLRWTIRSVLAQACEDWELLVIGDACTDDSEAVVASFSDPRISFVNLAENVGDQSGPNNEGVRRARGEYVAFLNHDDLWFPDHLERCIATIETTGSDLVYSIVDRPYPNGRRMANGIFPSGRYLPGAPVPASSWLFRRSLARSVGPWRHHRETRSIPSQDWLFRAWRGGARIALVPHLTVVTIGTSARPGCYTNRDEAEQAEYWHNIESDPSTRERVLAELLVQEPDWFLESMDFLCYAPLKRLLGALVYKPVKPLLLRIGQEPKGFRQAMARRPKGYQVTRLRRIRGLDEIPAASGSPSRQGGENG